MRKTKIICTIGPSTSGLDSIRQLIDNGMNAARLNFSHGSHQFHTQAIENIREAAKQTNQGIAVIQDLQGPKIRTGKVVDGAVELIEGNEFIITIDDTPFGDSKIVGTSYKNLVYEVKENNTILLDDGYLILTVNNVDSKNIYTTVNKGGILRDNKGIITPGVSSKAPSLNKKDLEDLAFGLNAGVDAVALSFVRSERDVIELRATMKVLGRQVPIISKIERYEGVKDIVDIINESDAIMVARGDLGLEMPAEQVPVLQKEIIKSCNYYGKPVIIATQMLESMINNPRPTRAEASDVANAVIDGADSVMLSGETSIGKYPNESVNYMNRIITVIEDKYDSLNKNYLVDYFKTNPLSEALGKAACIIADNIDAKAIVTLTKSGFTALNISKFRPLQPVIAFTQSKETAKFFSIVRGIKGICTKDTDFNHLIDDNIFNTLIQLEYAKKGNYIVIVSGMNISDVDMDNMIKIHKL